MSLGEILAPGACVFLGLTVGLGLGVSSSGLGEALGDGLGVSLGVGVGEAFFLRLPFGDGEGELVGVGVSDASGVGLGVEVGVFFAELPFFFLGDGLGVGSGVDFFFGEAEGDAPGDGDGLGDGVGDAFFLLDAFRFFGGGVGSKIRFIFVPRSCWAKLERTPPPMSNAHAISRGSARLFARAINEPVPAKPLC